MAPPKKVFPLGVRTCSKCGEVKPVDHFHQLTYCYDCHKKQSAEWKQRNREKVAVYNAQYKSMTDSERLAWIATRSEQRKQAKQDNALHRHFTVALRQRIYGALSPIKRTAPRRPQPVKQAKKADRTFNLLGCTLEFFLAWLKYNFEPGMTLANHGDVWHIDHVVPCARFDLTKEVDQRVCFHWTNMRPLWARENQSKCMRVTQEDVSEQGCRVGEFIGGHGLDWEGCYALLGIDADEWECGAC